MVYGEEYARAWAPDLIMLGVGDLAVHAGVDRPGALGTGVGPGTLALLACALVAAGYRRGAKVRRS